jgi:hypothetical protein
MRSPLTMNSATQTPRTPPSHNTAGTSTRCSTTNQPQKRTFQTCTVGSGGGCEARLLRTIEPTLPQRRSKSLRFFKGQVLQWQWHPPPPSLSLSLLHLPPLVTKMFPGASVARSGGGRVLTMNSVAHPERCRHNTEGRCKGNCSSCA